MIFPSMRILRAMPLSPRKIGNVLVPPVGFGIMGISHYYGSTDSDEERLKVLDAAYAGGCTHWDSANIYGDSEELIAKWFQKTGKRKEIFLATKFGATANGGRGDPEYIKEQCALSLKRLNTDYIDLYYQHRPDPKVPVEVSVAAMAELVKEGKVKHIGLSEFTAADIRRAHAVHPIAAIQVEYSPFVLDIEYPDAGVLQTARELGITVVAYSPLGRGLVTGRYKSRADFEEGDFRLALPKFSDDNFPRILNIVDRISEIAKKHNATPGQVTLAWILAQGEEFVVIPGTKKVKYLEENLGAANVQLSDEEMAEMRTIAEEACRLPGTRYSAPGMAMAMVDTPPLKK